jgi:O-antigen/teichoic acid export membrane protein
MRQMAVKPADDGERDAAEADLLATPLAGPAAIRGGALRVAGYVAGVVLSVGSAALLFRHLGVEDGGRYVTVLALVATVQGLTDFGLTAVGVRELAVAEGSERERVVRALLGLRLVLTAVGVAGAVAFAAVAGYGETLVLGTALAGAGLVVQNLQSTLGTALMVDMRLGWLTLIEFARQLVTVVLIASLVVAGAELLPFLAIPLPAAGVALALTVVLVRGPIPLAPSFARSAWGPLLRDVLPYAMATAAAALYFRLAIVLLSLISSARETGYFAAAFRVVEVLVVVPQLLVTAAFPIFARAARDDRARLGYGVQRMFEACTLLGGWLALVLVLGAPLIIDVIAGPDFAPSVDVLRIQAVTVFALFVATSWSYALLSLREHRAILVITLATLALNCTLVATLASSDGATGAALGTLIADLVALALLGARLARAHPDMRPDLGVLPRVLAAAGAAALLSLLGLPQIPLLIAATIVYGAVLLALRAVPEEIFVELRRPRSGTDGSS